MNTNQVLIKKTSNAWPNKKKPKMAKMQAADAINACFSGVVFISNKIWNKRNIRNITVNKAIISPLPLIGTKNIKF